MWNFVIQYLSAWDIILSVYYFIAGAVTITEFDNEDVSNVTFVTALMPNSVTLLCVCCIRIKTHGSYLSLALCYGKSAVCILNDMLCCLR